MTNLSEPHQTGEPSLHGSPALSPEFAFLCAVLSPTPDLGRAQSLARKNLNWPEVRKLAFEHGVRPRLLKALRLADFGPDAAALRDHLEAFQRGHAPVKLQFAAELLKITQTLHSHKIQFAVFKGVSLAHRLYGDLAGREFNDIDVIVAPDAMDPAIEILKSLGYEPRVASKAFRQAFLAYQQQYMIENKNLGLVIDLHWGFVTKGVPFPIAPSEIWGTLATRELAGRGLPVFGDEELALFLAGHGLKEGWKSLGWVLDFALLIDQSPAIDWNSVHRRASQRGCGRSILIAALLASQLFNARIAPHLLDLALADRACTTTAASMIARMQVQAHRGQEEELRGSFAMCETWWQSARVMWRLCVTRTTGDYEAMPLPPALWRLYHFTRPVRLLMQMLRPPHRKA